MTTTRVLWTLGAAILAAGAAVSADQAAPLNALAKMPVKEITVFKDGHVLVLHEGKMPTDEGDDVLMDYLPTPIMGAFWPYSADKDVKLTGVVAGRRKVRVNRTALNLRELLEANVNAEVVIHEVPAVKDDPGARYDATIVGIPARSGEELEATSPPNAGEMLPRKGDLILLKTAQGVKAVPIGRIQEVTFKNAHEDKLGSEEFRNLLRLQLDWGKAKPRKAADVGMMYVQKGVRWIPHYKIDIDGKGTATVKLQATLLNELTDLNDVTAQLVIGVPTFALAETPDPISLQQTVARLSRYFTPGSRVGSQFSNAMMTQTNIAVPSRPDAGPRPMDLGPAVPGSGAAEDLFVFTVEHVTLRKGERMVLPIAEFTLPYRDVFVLDIPFTPTPEVWRSFNSRRRSEVARALAAPRVMHNIRLTNKSPYPLTTAPALIVRGRSVLAQGLMTYTPKGADTDLEITASVDIPFRKSDKETKRTPNAAVLHGNQYARIDFEGVIHLTSYRTKPTDLEVTRHVLGNTGKADHDGKVEMLNAFEDSSYLPSRSSHPFWWGWYSWPSWWAHFNGIGRIRWDVKLEPGKSVELKYTWHYFWR